LRTKAVRDRVAEFLLCDKGADINMIRYWWLYGLETLLLKTGVVRGVNRYWCRGARKILLQVRRGDTLVMHAISWNTMLRRALYLIAHGFKYVLMLIRVNYSERRLIYAYGCVGLGMVMKML